MPKLEPKQLTRNQQRELDRKRRAKREKAKVQKSKQRSRLTEDAKELQRDKDRVRMSRSRERRSGALEGKAQLLEEYRAQKGPHCAKNRASKKEAEEARSASEKKDPVAGYPKLSQVGLPPPPDTKLYPGGSLAWKSKSLRVHFQRMSMSRLVSNCPIFILTI